MGREIKKIMDIYELSSIATVCYLTASKHRASLLISLRGGKRNRGNGVTSSSTYRITNLLEK